MRGVGLIVLAVGLLLAGGALAWWGLSWERDYGTFDYHHPDFPWPLVFLGVIVAGFGLVVTATRR
jgi:hypothetical protein